jgi:methyl-accepting chemotaxis protein
MPILTKSFRWQLVWKAASLFAAGTGLATAIFLLTIQERPGASYAESFLIFARLQDEILAKSLFVSGTVLALTLAGVLALILLFSHRVVGPLQRLGGTLRLMAAGDLSQTVTLRDKDAVQPLAREINGLGGRYREMMEGVRLQVRELEKQAVRVGAARTDAEMKAALAEIGHTATEIERALGRIGL